MTTVRLFCTIILLLALSSRQNAQNVSGSASLAQGVNIVVGPMDEFTRTWDLRADHIRDAAVNSIESVGWVINNGSNLLVTVNIRSLTQRNEDKYLFTIEVHGGTSTLIVESKQGQAGIIGDIPGVKTVEVPWNDAESIINVTKQLVKNVANKLRREVLRKSLQKKKTLYNEDEYNIYY